MKKYKPLFITAAVVVAILVGIGALFLCKSFFGTEETELSVSEVDFSQIDRNMFTERDIEGGYDASNIVEVELQGSSAQCDSDNVTVSGGVVTINNGGTYFFSGTLDDGMIMVDAPNSEKVQIVLNGVDITSSSSAPVYVLNANKVFLTLEGGTDNKLSNGGAFVAVDENNIDGTVFSKQDLTINGNGSLTVNSPVGHGIVCKDDLVVSGGVLNIEASFHGLDVNNSIRITNAEIMIKAGKDGIHSELEGDNFANGYVFVKDGTFNITAEGDGVSAGSYVIIENGGFQIVAGGGYQNGTKASSESYGGNGGKKNSRQPNTTTEENSVSMKGIKAENNILIENGKFDINSADDAIHSNASVVIEGGIYNISTGDDAVHGENTLTVSNGEMNVVTSYEGLEALKIYVNGGDIVLNCSDDGLNAAGGVDQSGNMGGRDGMFSPKSSSGNGVVEILGGNLTVYSGGDGLDSNGSLSIKGGYIYVANPKSGDTSVLDTDGDAIITGGTLISTGASTMQTQGFDSSSAQGFVLKEVGNQPAGSDITLKDESGNTVVSYKSEYDLVLVIISHPDIKSGEKYTLTVGSYSDTVKAK